MRAWLVAFLLMPGAAMAQAVGGTPTNSVGQVPIVAPSVNFTSGQGTVTTGGTAVTAIAAGGMTHGCDLVNPSSATEALFFSIGGTANTSTSLSLGAGTAYHCPFGTSQALSVNAATSGHTFQYLGY